MAPWSTTSSAAKVLAAQLRAETGATGPRSKVRPSAFAHMALYVSYGDTDWANRIAHAMYGIDYAANTGRLAGSIVTEIRHLSDYRMCALVAEIATECKVSGEVPRFLISRFASN